MLLLVILFIIHFVCSLNVYVFFQCEAGDVVWLSWCPNGRADDGKEMKGWQLTLQHGATCVGVSVPGAIAMSDAMQKSTPKHFDIWLKEALVSKRGLLSPSGNQFFGASYLWPPMGSYAAVLALALRRWLQPAGVPAAAAAAPAVNAAMAMLADSGVVIGHGIQSDLCYNMPEDVRRRMREAGKWLDLDRPTNATHKSANAAGSSKANRKARLTAQGFRLEDWGYPNQSRTRIPRDVDGQELDRASHPQQVWHAFQLVHIHGAEHGSKRIVCPQYVERGCAGDSAGKVHLDGLATATTPPRSWVPVEGTSTARLQTLFREGTRALFHPCDGRLRGWHTSEQRPRRRSSCMGRPSASRDRGRGSWRANATDRDPQERKEIRSSPGSLSVRSESTTVGSVRLALPAVSSRHVIVGRHALWGMCQCLWWTVGAAAMNDLDKWTDAWIAELADRDHATAEAGQGPGPFAGAEDQDQLGLEENG